ncbi:hypothetical protein [Mycobacterium avium]|uniref:hypothetical protein n=1 Tax=Mycobacterium avium TaxID=1764 RepID=UPI000B4BAEB8|nr:hypothetical protein [Mycobacterium avium]
MTALFDHDFDDDLSHDDHEYHAEREARLEEYRRAEAAKKARQRARERRDALSARVDVLDELACAEQVEALVGHVALDDVADFFDVDPSVLRTLLRKYGDEFARDGWTGARSRYGTDAWTDRAVVRAALLLDDVSSERAAEIRYRLDVAALPVAFSSRGVRIKECERLFAQAMETVAQVQGEASPETFWRGVQEMPRYELQALAVALAALVPTDDVPIGGFLRDIGGPQRRVAEGLAQLVPLRSALYQRRRRAGRDPRSSEPGGVKISARR